jgi:dihydropteroate synthase
VLAQIVDLTRPKVFDKYRLRYNYSWDYYGEHILGLEIRMIPDDSFAIFKNKILAIHPLAFCLENAGNNSRILLLGNNKIFRGIAEKCVNENLLKNMLDLTINNYENYDNISYEIKGKEFNFNSAYVMGILNVTPDSFSDGGKFLNHDQAAEYGIEMIDSGVDIVDIGGESSRPGAEQVSADEEANRVIPVIQRILLERPTAILSVDTTKNIVASKALQHGAVIINDISALRLDLKLIETVKKFNASLVLAHMQGNPKTMQINPEYENVVEEVYDVLSEQAESAKKIGVKNIFVDPGIGFGKSVEHNLELIQRLSDFKSLGYPILVGVSRKSFLGKILNLEIENRDIATAITETVAITNGARIIRTHNFIYGNQVSKLVSSVL